MTNVSASLIGEWAQRGTPQSRDALLRELEATLAVLHEYRTGGGTKVQIERACSAADTLRWALGEMGVLNPSRLVNIPVAGVASAPLDAVFAVDPVDGTPHSTTTRAKSFS